MAPTALVTVSPNLRITEAGRPLVRAVAAVFDTYLARRTARHSIAV